MKVDIGIPHELWGKPPAEVTQLKSQCESLLERHEEDIEHWYFHRQREETLEEHLCRNAGFLKTEEDRKCLDVKGEVDKKEEL